jgi:protein subunit release factor A
MKEFILENWKTGLWILFASGFVFEITPIKIKPLSALLKWIGKNLNKDVRDDISKLEVKVDCVKNDMQSHTVESQRRDILNYASELRNGEKKTEEHFVYIMKLHDRYEEYTKRNKIKNSQADLAYEYILDMYKKCRDGDGFL